MAVPGWPELALRGASMANPRTSRIASCSIASITCLLGVRSAFRLRRRSAVADGRAEECHRRGEPMHHVAAADGPQLAGAEHPGHRQGTDDVLDDGGVVMGITEHGTASPIAGEQQATTR